MTSQNFIPTFTARLISIPDRRLRGLIMDSSDVEARAWREIHDLMLPALLAQSKVDWEAGRYELVGLMGWAIRILKTIPKSLATRVGRRA
jgi:hypothetical protein